MAINTISPTKADVILHIQQNITAIKSFGVKRLGLFGSYVKQKQTPQSDIDLLVEFETDQKTFDNFMGLAFLLEDTLQKPVELVTPESLSPYIGPYILKEVEYVTFTE